MILLINSNAFLFNLLLITVKSTDSLGNHLNNLLRDAENRIQELSGIEDTPQAPFSTRASFSSIIGKSMYKKYMYLFAVIWILRFTEKNKKISSHVEICSYYMCENSIVTNNFKLPTKRFHVRKFDNSLERKLRFREKKLRIEKVMKIIREM